MGLSLADFGLAYQGANAVLDAGRRRDYEEEDRKHQLAKRERDEEMAKAALEESRRAQAYQAELRTALPAYLAGGAKGLAAQEAVEGQPADDGRLYEDGSVPRTAKAAQPAQDDVEGMYGAMKDIAAKHGRLDHYEAMKGRLKTAEEEGIVDFIKKARQGASDTELLSTFNKRGKVKLAGIRKVNDDEYAAITEDGKPVSLNLTRMTEAMLSPKEMLAHRDKSEQTQARLTAQRENNDARSVAQQARLDQQRTENESRAELARARAAVAEAKAAGGDAPKERTPGNWNAFNAEVRRIAKSQLTSKDPETNKDVVDHKNVASLSSMAGEIARGDPSLTAAEAVEAARDKMEELRGAQDNARDQADREATGLKFDDTKKRERWVNRRTELLLRPAGEKKASAASASAPAPAPAAAAAPARPTSVEEYKALPKGAKYVNPADNKVYTKN